MPRKCHHLFFEFSLFSHVFMEMPLSQSTPEGKNKLLPLPGKLLNQRKLKSFFSPFEHSCYNILWCRGAVYFRNKQVKPGFTNYQPQPKYSRALSKIEWKRKLVKTKDLLEEIWKPEIFWKSNNLKKSELFCKSAIIGKSEIFWKSNYYRQSLK